MENVTEIKSLPQQKGSRLGWKRIDYLMLSFNPTSPFFVKPLMSLTDCVDREGHRVQEADGRDGPVGFTDRPCRLLSNLQLPFQKISLSLFLKFL